MIVSDSKGYHLSCYKKYTAIKNKEVESELSKQKALDEQSVLVQSTLQPTAQPASGNWNIVEIIGTIQNPSFYSDSAVYSTISTRSLRSTPKGKENEINPRTGVHIEKCIFCLKKRKEFNNKV